MASSGNSTSQSDQATTTRLFANPNHISTIVRIVKSSQDSIVTLVLPTSTSIILGAHTLWSSSFPFHLLTTSLPSFPSLVMIPSFAPPPSYIPSPFAFPSPSFRSQPLSPHIWLLLRPSHFWLTPFPSFPSSFSSTLHHNPQVMT